MPSDPHRVLGLDPGATPAEIKRAYRVLAKAYHPDSAGEAALARFLAIQAAYEQLASAEGRPAGRSRAGARPAEPWRADPARASEARGGARASGPDRPTGARAKAGSASGGPKTSTGGTRRRSTKKATFGSTTYDEAHAPVDPAWQGASWYGPSSGEYWTVNPREYADPRKHGPEYQARAATRATQAQARSDRAPTAGAEEAVAAAATGRAAGSGRAAAARAAAARAETSARARTAGSVRQAADGPARTAGPAGPATSTNLGFGAAIARLESPPLRRAILALAAWPPLGIAAAALIGEITGCAAFSAACTSTAALYPWLAQFAILLALALLPAIARLLAGGTAAVALLAFPVAAALSASGASYDRAYGPASLIGILTVVWLAGVVSMAVRRHRSRPAT